MSIRWPICIIEKVITILIMLLGWRAWLMLRLDCWIRRKCSTGSIMKLIWENILSYRTWYLYFCLRCCKKSQKISWHMQASILTSLTFRNWSKFNQSIMIIAIDSHFHSCLFCSHTSILSLILPFLQWYNRKYW
jgi:hypothetical protein